MSCDGPTDKISMKNGHSNYGNKNQHKGKKNKNKNQKGKGTFEGNCKNSTERLPGTIGARELLNPLEDDVPTASSITSCSNLLQLLSEPMEKRLSWKSRIS